MDISGSIKDIIKKTNAAKDRLLKKLTAKSDFKSILDDISGVLDPHDMEIIVVRGKTCEILFTNTRAENRLYNEDEAARTCKTIFAKQLPGLCDHCPYGEGQNQPGLPPLRSMIPKEGHLTSEAARSTGWTEKPRLYL